VGSDIRLLIAVVIPIIVILYLLLTLPIAALFIIVNKIVKTTTFSQNIILTGERFGGLEMIRRAVVPTLVSVASGQLVFNMLPEWLFRQPRDDIPMVIAQLYYPLETIIGTLILLPVVLLYFVPTWVLNDSGIVSHLKSEKLEYRRCPDTLGVGRWYSNFLGGFTLIAIPVTSFVQNYYIPFVVKNVPITPFNIMLSVIWTVGVPFIAMAFVIPAIIVNELFLTRMKKQVHKIAKSFGATEVTDIPDSIQPTSLDAG
jgi:hypothetical protein